MWCDTFFSLIEEHVYIEISQYLSYLWLSLLKQEIYLYPPLLKYET